MPICFDILNKGMSHQRNELVCDVERRKGRGRGEGRETGGGGEEGVAGIESK